jgi:hypothetical protein
MKIKTNQNGFSAIDIILVIVALGTIGAAVYFAVYHKAPVANTANNTTTKKAATASPTSTINQYAGWKTYCGTTSHGCFKYPAGWSTSSVPGEIILAESPNQTVTAEYSDSTGVASGLGNFTTTSINPMYNASTNQKVVGGYYTVSNVPGFNVIDASLLSQYGLAVGKTSDVSNAKGLSFTVTPVEGASRYILSVHYNNQTGNATIGTSQASSWLGTSDAKTAELIAQSYYIQ